MQDCRTAEIENGRVEGLQDGWTAGIERRRIAGLQDCRITGVEKCRITGKRATAKVDWSTDNEERIQR